jgi:hypothetical protein
MIVANTGKVTELIEHRGSLQSAQEEHLTFSCHSKNLNEHKGF